MQGSTGTQGSTGNTGMQGSTGPTGPNLLLSNNVFSGTNAFTNTVTISSLAVSTTGNLLLATTNVSTQNTQITQTATSNPTTSYTVMQALHSNTVGSGITYNTLALNPNGGKVGVGTSTPDTTLHVFNSTADASAAPDGGSNIGQLLLRNSKVGISPYSMTVGVDQSTGVGYLNAAGNGAYQSICLNTRGGNIGIGTTNPSSVLQVNGTTAVNSLLMNAGGTAFQIARARNVGSGVSSGSVTFPFTFANVPAVTVSLTSASNTQVFSVNVSNVTTTGFTYTKTFYSISGGGGAANEPFDWIAVG